MAIETLPRPGQTKYHVLVSLIEFTKKNAFGPTMEELAEVVGLSHRSTIHHHLHDLLNDDLVEKEEGRKRAFRPTRKGRRLVELLSK